MKLKKTILFAILFGLLSMNLSYAIVDKKVSENDNNIQENEITEYNNDIHSVFSLEDCVNIAIKNNPQIQSALYNEAVYKTKIGQAWANYFPKLSAGVQGEYQNIHASKNNYYASTRGSGFNTSVSGDMLLFDFGKTKATADSAKRTYESKQEDTKENINTIIYDIKSTYFNILFAQAQVKVYEDTVADYELQLKQAWGFYNIGKKAKIDVVTAEYNLGKAKLNLVKAKNVLLVANVQLSKIMGIPEYTNFELSDKLSTKLYNIEIEEAIQTAYSVRPELISAQKKVDSAKMTLRAQKRDYTPDLGFFAGYGYGSEAKLSSTQVGVGLNYNGLNIAKIKKKVDEAKASYKKSMADYDDVKNTVYLNVKKNYMNLETAKEEITIAKLSLDQAQEQYRQVTGRYKAGIGDAIELKDGETTYLNARLDFYNTLLNYNMAVASLEKEIGIPLEPTEGNVLDNNIDKQL